VLIKLWKTQAKNGGTFSVIAPHEAVIKWFTAVRLESIIKTYRSVPEFEAAVRETRGIQYDHKIRSKVKYTVIDITEPFNIFCGYQEFNDLMESLIKNGARFVALNLTGIIHLYSEVIGAFIKWRNFFCRNDGDFCIFGLSEELRERMNDLQMDQVLDMYSAETDLE
jgi:anti-anti-sigma regulatory factor